MDNVPYQEEDLSQEDLLGFKWLQFGSRGSTYTSYNEFQNLPACSFDFGADGYAGSLNHGGELLQMSSPSENHGIIFARGDPYDSLYSYLARAQRTVGGKSTFGLKLDPNQPFYRPPETNLVTGKSYPGSLSAFRLGKIIERGCFNYRWPVHEYALLLNEEKTKETGTCTFFSFVQNRTLYQLLHLEQVCRPEFDTCFTFPPVGHVDLLVGGPMHFQVLHSAGPDTDSEEEAERKRIVQSLEPDTMDNWRCEQQQDDSSSVRLNCKVFQLERDDGQWKPLSLTKPEENKSSKLDSFRPCGYNVRANLPEAKNIRYMNKRVTFLAAFELYDGPYEAKLDRPPSPKEIYDYVGAKSSNYSSATGAMWQTLFLEKAKDTYHVSELSEVNLVARCLEKILQVDIIPASFNSGNPTKTSLAVVSNLFIRAEIDLKALFWKVRFLVKAHNFLCHVFGTSSNTSNDSLQHGGKDPARRIAPSSMVHGDQKNDKDAADNTNEIAQAQIGRIQDAVKGIFTFLYEAYLKQESSTPLRPHSLSASRLGPIDYYYVMMTIWYLIKNLPSSTEWIPPLDDDSWIKTRTIQSGAKTIKMSCWLASEDGLPPDVWTFGQDTKLKIMLNQWYHYGSILRLLQHKYMRNGMTIDGAIHASWGMHRLYQKVQRLRTATKISLAARIASRKPYTAYDEIIDRLAFLADELGLENANGDTGTIASLVTKRIKHRCFTTEINPGPELNLALDTVSASGPWEIHALCHHSRLFVAHLDRLEAEDQGFKEKYNEEVEKYKRKFCRFLTTDASLVPCWERTNLMVRRGWLRSEATSVLASTLLELCQYDMDQSLARIGGSKIAEHTAKTALLLGISSAMMKLPQTSSSVQGKQRVEPTQNGLDHASVLQDGLLLMAKLLGKQTEVLEGLANKGDSAGQSYDPPIDWENYRPPLRYHPDDFFSSLSRTPEYYQHNFICKRQVPPPLAGYLSDFLKTKFQVPIEWSDIIKRLNSVSVLDIKASDSGWEMGSYDSEDSTSTDSTVGQYDLKAEGALSDPVKRRNYRVKVVGALNKAGKFELSRSLTESLVDQSVQHRIFIAPKLDNDVVSVLFYVLHPESEVYLCNHARRFSQFSCQRGNPWVSGITLRCWSRVSKNRRAINRKDDRRTEDDRPISLPVEVMGLLKERHPDSATADDNIHGQVELNVSTFVMKTNDFGEFSKCSIISDIIPSQKLKDLGDEGQAIWHNFIHQPQVARCLVFMLILGRMCSEAALSFKDAGEYVFTLPPIDQLLKTDKSNLVRGDYSLVRLKHAVWSLESLSKMRSSLDQSMKSIGYAKAELMTQLSRVPGKRSAPLEKMFQDHLELFERSVGELRLIDWELERKFKVNRRYRDALSTMLTLSDSKRLIRQGKTIQRLTYTTIVYLPFGLAAAIFTIPDTQKAVRDKMGLGWFIGSSFILMLTTFTAVFLEPIRKWIRNRFNGSGGGDGSDASQLQGPPRQEMHEGTSGRGVGQVEKLNQESSEAKSEPLDKVSSLTSIKSVTPEEIQIVKDEETGLVELTDTAKQGHLKGLFRIRRHR